MYAKESHPSLYSPNLLITTYDIGCLIENDWSNTTQHMDAFNATWSIHVRLIRRSINFFVLFLFFSVSELRIKETDELSIGWIRFLREIFQQICVIRANIERKSWICAFLPLETMKTSSSFVIRIFSKASRHDFFHRTFTTLSDSMLFSGTHRFGQILNDFLCSLK